MNCTQATLFELKECDEDFEWYPTTDAMIRAVFKNYSDFGSVLDVGAGDGRVLEKLAALSDSSYVEKYAIEKSAVHIENMPPDIAIVGTDFMLQTLIDKRVDVVFCNPPYSEYEAWAVKTIKEAYSKVVFLVIPQRWKSSKPIKDAIKQRKANSRVIWSGDFADADRQARSEVDILRVSMPDLNSYGHGGQADPFDVWFDEYFAGFNALKPLEDEKEDWHKPPRHKLKELCKGHNLIDRLHELYVADMNTLLENYKTLSRLDPELLREIGVEVAATRQALKQKIEGLKNKYWEELFDNLDKITNRLTSGSRQSILEKLRASCNIDFTPDNAYAVVVWTIKNANLYIDSQLVALFKELSEPECVKNYKSNLKTWEKDGWRYNKDHTHYTLDYRIITHKYNAIKNCEFSDYEYPGKLHNTCHALLNDIMTIANNLGFSNCDNSECHEWESNKEVTFYMHGSGGSKVLFKVRAFKNGNLHLKLDQNFIKTLNVEASRLLGWIKTPQEAVDEMGLSINFVKKHFRSNLLFGVNDGQKLLT